MPGRGGKRRRGQGKGGRGGGRGGSRGRGRPTKRKRKSASVEPGKERPAAQEEDSSEDESSDEEVRPTAYQRLVQSSRRDLQTVAALAATSTEHAGATKALDDPAAGNAKGGGDISHGGSEGDLAAGDSGDDSSSGDDDGNSSDGDDNVTGGNARVHAAAAESTEERHADKSDSFRRIFFGKELSEPEYTRQRKAVTDARLRHQGTAGCLHIESAVAEAPAVHRKLSDNLVRSSIRARFSALAGRSRLTQEEASVYSYLRSYCDVFHAACTHKSATNWERLTMVHVLNHVLR